MLRLPFIVQRVSQSHISCFGSLFARAPRVRFNQKRWLSTPTKLTNHEFACKVIRCGTGDLSAAICIDAPNSNLGDMYSIGDKPGVVFFCYSNIAWVLMTEGLPLPEKDNGNVAIRIPSSSGNLPTRKVCIIPSYFPSFVLHPSWVLSFQILWPVFFIRSLVACLCRLSRVFPSLMCQWARICSVTCSIVLASLCRDILPLLQPQRWCSP